MAFYFARIWLTDSAAKLVLIAAVSVAKISAANKIVYANAKVCIQCTSLEAAKKVFGGQKSLAISLLARINAIKSALYIKDIIVQKQFRFHQLKNKNGQNLEGYFAIDVKTIRDPWRLILRPLDKNKKPFVPCHIDEIAEFVEIVEIREVSNHYE